MKETILTNNTKLRLKKLNTFQLSTEGGLYILMVDEGLLLGEDVNGNEYYFLNNMVYRVSNITNKNNTKSIVEYKPLE